MTCATKNLLVSAWLSAIPAISSAAICHDALTNGADHAYESSLISDFAFRDALPQTKAPEERWQSTGRYGPHPAKYPSALPPSGYDRLAWQRDRIIAVAKKYIGLPYKHAHIPAFGGLDCSNFSSWVYNYGLGIRINSSVRKQAYQAGRVLDSTESVEPGDLLFFWSKDRTWISHVAIVIDEDHLIDSTGPGVAIRPFQGWYRSRWAFVRRVIE